MNHAASFESLLRERPPDHPPGQSYAYSNFGWRARARDRARSSRQIYPAFVGDAFFKRFLFADVMACSATSTPSSQAPPRGQVLRTERRSKPGMNLASRLVPSVARCLAQAAATRCNSSCRRSPRRPHQHSQARHMGIHDHRSVANAELCERLGGRKALLPPQRHRRETSVIVERIPHGFSRWKRPSPEPEGNSPSTATPSSSSDHGRTGPRRWRV